jgi:phosphatidylglycerol:prolipoprotein diacylglycerol transferase
VIPFPDIPSIPIAGPIQLHPFGLLVATGILVGSWWAQRLADKKGAPIAEIRSAVAWGTVVGFIGAHLVAIGFYFPGRIADEGPVVLLKVWDGISSFGGFSGAIAGVFMFYGHRGKKLGPQIAVLAMPFAAIYLTGFQHVPGMFAYIIAVAGVFWFYWPPNKPWLMQFEILLQGCILGWVFGRLGCTVAFDHPGVQTDFILAFMYKDTGTIRHNLGFYEAIYTLLILFPTVVMMSRMKARAGLTTAVVCFLYAPTRFLADALRARDLSSADIRFMDLTPGQFSAIGLLLLGAFMLWYAWQRPVDLDELAIAVPETKPAKTKGPARRKGKGKGKGKQRP